MSAEESETEVTELARAVIEELDPGTTIGNKIILSRRQLLAVAGGGLSVGALATLGVGKAEAQSAVGTIGTASSPVDVEAVTVNGTTANLDQTNTTGLAVNGVTQTVTADQDAVDAVNAEASLSVDVTGNSDTVDGFDIQKNGTDGNGIINFKT